jgi:hypothetical protein
LSLQGTLDTFSLPEILELVEKSRKTGALEVRDPQSRGVLYFAGGRFSAAEAGDLNGPVESAEELEARLIDVCFALFRVETGLYEFESDRFPPWPVRGGSEVAPIVEQVQQLRRDWLAIEAVLPSLECRPGVVEDLDGDRVVLNKAGFRVLRVVDGDRNVREIARVAGRSVLEVCKVLKDLVEAGAVVVPTDPARTMVDELVLTVEEAADPVGTPVPAFVDEAVVDARVDPVEAAFPESAAPADAEPPFAEAAFAEAPFDEAPFDEPAPTEASAPEPPPAEYPGPPSAEAPPAEPAPPEAGYEESELPELPEVPGLVVPSSPEGLTDDGEHYESGAGLRDSVAEAREAEQSGEVTTPPTGADEPATAVDDDDEDTDDEPAPDRGALLRMFSSLRDT